MDLDTLLTGAHDRAAFAHAGVTDHDLRTGPWQRTNRGLYAATFTDARQAEERILRAYPLLPDGDAPANAIGGWAAARVLGARTLDGFDGDLVKQDVLLCIGRHARVRRTEDVRVFRSELEPHEIHVVAGLRVTSPLRTLVDLARLAPTPAEGVVAVDALRAAVDVDLFDAVRWLDEHPLHTGLTKARRVLGLSRPGVKSPQETRFRLLWTQEAGLPEPLVNARVYEGDGRLVAEVDLLDPETGLAGEYDGASHAPAAQRSVDTGRREHMSATGLTPFVVHSVDLKDGRKRTILRLRSAYASARLRPRGSWYLAP